MGCNCGNKNKQQKAQQNLQRFKNNKDKSTDIPVKDYVNALKNK